MVDPTSAFASPLSTQVLPNSDQKTVTTTTSRDSDGDLESKKVIVEKIQMPDGVEKVRTEIIDSEDKNDDGKPEEVKISEKIQNNPGSMSSSMMDPTSASASPLYMNMPSEAYQYSPGESSSWLTKVIEGEKNQGKPIDWGWMYKYYKKNGISRMVAAQRN